MAEEKKIDDASTTAFGAPCTDKPVLVTGVGGFCASHIAKQLLERGYRVRGTVRSTKDAATKYKWLYDLDTSETKDRLELVSGNLMEPGSYDDAVVGCEYVMHVASPYAVNVKDAQRELVDPAVGGTKSVLASCAKADGVKRVILTSSIAAITDQPIDGHVYNEKDWNIQSSLKRNPYYFSKRLAEMTAWQFMKKQMADDALTPDQCKDRDALITCADGIDAKDNQRDFDLVVVNPFIVVGPELKPYTQGVPVSAEGRRKNLNESNALMHDVFVGKFPATIALGWGLVDVRDVALCHILCMESPTAAGRHLCCANTYAMRDVSLKIKERYPNSKAPTLDMTGGVGSFLTRLGSYFQGSGTGQYLRTNLGSSVKVNNSKCVDKLSMTFRDPMTAVFDLLDSLVSAGVVDAKLAQPGKRGGGCSLTGSKM